MTLSTAVHVHAARHAFLGTQRLYRAVESRAVVIELCLQSEEKTKRLTDLIFNRRAAGLKDVKHNAWCRKCTTRRPRLGLHLMEDTEGFAAMQVNSQSQSERIIAPSARGKAR